MLCCCLCCLVTQGRLRNVSACCRMGAQGCQHSIQRHAGCLGSCLLLKLGAQIAQEPSARAGCRAESASSNKHVQHVVSLQQILTVPEKILLLPAFLAVDAADLAVPYQVFMHGRSTVASVMRKSYPCQGYVTSSHLPT